VRTLPDNEENQVEVTEPSVPDLDKENKKYGFLI